MSCTGCECPWRKLWSFWAARQMLRRRIAAPSPKEKFIETSVAIPKSGNWVARFENILGRAASVRVLGHLHVPGSTVGLDYCNSVMIGLARLYARSLDLELNPLAVWDGFPGA